MSRKTSGAALLAAACLLSADAWGQPAFWVVVPADLPDTEVTRAELSRIFLAKASRWPSGEIAVPVNQQAGAGVREAFSQAVHGRSAESIESFWQRAVFSGRAVPPPELTTDREVLEFVRARPGAVGYVTAGVALGGGVRVLGVVDDIGEPLFAAVPAADDPEVAAGPARDAVEIVAAGSCGRDRSGRFQQVINRHPFRSVSVKIQHVDRVGGKPLRTYTRTLSIAPGDEKRLGCSADGRLTREFQVAEAGYR